MSEPNFHPLQLRSQEAKFLKWYFSPNADSNWSFSPAGKLNRLQEAAKEIEKKVNNSPSTPHHEGV